MSADLYVLLRRVQLDYAFYNRLLQDPAGAISEYSLTDAERDEILAPGRRIYKYLAPGVVRDKQRADRDEDGASAMVPATSTLAFEQDSEDEPPVTPPDLNLPPPGPPPPLMGPPDLSPSPPDLSPSPPDLSPSPPDLSPSPPGPQPPDIFQAPPITFGDPVGEPDAESRQRVAIDRLAMAVLHGPQDTRRAEINRLLKALDGRLAGR